MLTLAFVLCHMFPGGGSGHGGGEGGSQASYRVPPRWSPEMHLTYSFKAWVRDMMTWQILTDLTPPQQVAALAVRLGGAAKDLLQTLTTEEILVGGLVGVGLHPRALGHPRDRAPSPALAPTPAGAGISGFEFCIVRRLLL